jgi:hypothetical protein
VQLDAFAGIDAPGWPAKVAHYASLGCARHNPTDAQLGRRDFARKRRACKDRRYEGEDIPHKA